MIDIIVPVYNEGENIAILCELISKSIDLEYKICIIDDSNDCTTEIIKKLKNKYPIIHIKRDKKLGIGSAYKMAVRNTNNPYIIILDSDLSHNPIYIQKFLNHNSDIVISKRKKVINWSLKRKITSRIANNLAQLILGINFYDITGSFRMYKRKCLESIIENCKSNNFNFQVEIIYWALKGNFRIEEEDIVFYDRIIGKSKLNFVEIFSYIFMLLRMVLWN